MSSTYCAWRPTMSRSKASWSTSSTTASAASHSSGVGSTTTDARVDLFAEHVGVGGADLGAHPKQPFGDRNDGDSRASPVFVL